MQIADGFLLMPGAAGADVSATATTLLLVIEPWIATVPDVVVYEYGAWLDANGAAEAADQILKARHLYNALIGCIRIVHTRMNQWVLEQADARAQDPQAKLIDCELEIAAARAAAEVRQR
jgi:hypothetical protein